MTRAVTNTTVGIVGGGPAGLMLSHLLSIADIDSVVVDNRTRFQIENTVRAGILEADSVRLLTDTGVSDRVRRDGIAHRGIDLRFGGQNHRIDFNALVGESSWLYPQTDVFIDLANARDRDGGDVRFGVHDTRVTDVTGDRPGIYYTSADGASHEVRCDYLVGAELHSLIRNPSSRPIFSHIKHAAAGEWTPAYTVQTRAVRPIWPLRAASAAVHVWPVSGSPSGPKTPGLAAADTAGWDPTTVMLS